MIENRRAEHTGAGFGVRRASQKRVAEGLRFPTVHRTLARERVRSRGSRPWNSRPRRTRNCASRSLPRTRREIISCGSTLTRVPYPFNYLLIVFLYLGDRLHAVNTRRAAVRERYRADNDRDTVRDRHSVLGGGTIRSRPNPFTATSSPRVNRVNSQDLLSCERFDYPVNYLRSPTVFLTRLCRAIPRGSLRETMKIHLYYLTGLLYYYSTLVPLMSPH